MAETTVCEISLEILLNSRSLDISNRGTPRRYRLISCADFIDAGRLTIQEYTKFPEVPFAAVSYVWRGKAPDKHFGGRVFDVAVAQTKGAEPGDPIGVEVLHQACVASRASGATHLWLDRLCIMQTSKDDKQWQISQMYEIYRLCHICIVVPGGIQCLARLDEETQWIHRGWTLQEAVAPPHVAVLFSWTLGPCRAYAGDVQGEIQQVAPSISAMTSLSFILDASTTGSLSIEKGGKRYLLEVKLFSSHPADRSYNDFPFWRPTRRVLSPNVGALARIMSLDLDQDAKDHSIWQSALMRTSSRPVDMVFSIMGLFGVALDVSKFGKLDRVPATIALAQGILEKGGRATWLAAAFRIPPSRQISTFPVFPRTSVSGKAFTRTAVGLHEVSSMMENEYPVAEALVPMPSGPMDHEGYLTFTAKSIPIQLLLKESARTSASQARPTHLQAVDESWWEIQECGVEGQAFAVLCGFFVGYYPGSTPAHDAKNIRAMVIEEHARQKFHVRSYLMLSIAAKAWVHSWPARTFSIGGPAVDVVEDLGEALPIVSAFKELYLSNPKGALCSGDRPLEDQVSRRARWAVPLKALEQECARLEQTDLA